MALQTQTFFKVEVFPIQFYVLEHRVLDSIFAFIFSDIDAYHLTTKLGGLYKYVMNNSVKSQHVTTI